jgi:hypothetical protein
MVDVMVLFYFFFILVIFYSIVKTKGNDIGLIFNSGTSISELNPLFKYTCSISNEFQIFIKSFILFYIIFIMNKDGSDNSTNNLLNCETEYSFLNPVIVSKDGNDEKECFYMSDKTCKYFFLFFFFNFYHIFIIFFL